MEDGEFYVQEHEFKFHLRPYFLRLTALRFADFRLTALFFVTLPASTLAALHAQAFPIATSPLFCIKRLAPFIFSTIGTTMGHTMFAETLAVHFVPLLNREVSFVSSFSAETTLLLHATFNADALTQLLFPATCGKLGLWLLDFTIETLSQ